MARWSNMIEDLVGRVTKVGGTMLANSGQLSLPQKCDALLSNLGEATGLARSREILQAYQGLESAQRLEFFQTICRDFGVNHQALADALENWQSQPTNDSARQIHFASEPRSQELIRRLNLSIGGTATLVKMREDLIAFSKDDPSLLSLDNDLRHLFSSWFNRGFLRLDRIDWSTSAHILEKIIAYEAVHEIHGWDDLRRRVAAHDRRLYAFFHPSLADEPLIFVEVALTNGIPDTIDGILSSEREAIDPDKATTAVFYSISNCQLGLRGISFGNFLIKQVVEELKRELPDLKRFVTMSPVPGLRRWASTTSELTKKMQPLVAELRELESSPSDTFIEEKRGEVLALATHYLLNAKGKRGGPFDPVAKFHLGNGARLERINLWADLSASGMSGSWGVMVNYEYDLNHIERNHEAFLSEGTIITSPAIKRLNKNVS